MKLGSMLPKVRPLNTAADCVAYYDEVDTAIEDIEATVSEKIRSRATARLDGRDREVETLNSEIRSLQGDLEEARALKPEIERRRERLADDEKEADLQAAIDEAAEAAAAMVKHGNNFHQFMEKAVAELEAYKAHDVKVRKANQRSIDAGRLDLQKVVHPMAVLRSHLDTQIADPLELYHKIPFYHPPHPSGSPYRHFKDLKVTSWLTSRGS